MAVALIESGDSIDADKLNALFVELDALVSEVMDGKSPFMLSTGPSLNDLWAPLLGQPYYFRPPGAPELSGLLLLDGAPIYDHARMTANADAAIPILASIDETRKILPVQIVPDIQKFTFSLEAHQRAIGQTQYWLADGLPEKKWKFAVAELVYERIPSATISSTWNKFNCFRVHNLSSGELEWKTQDGFRMVIPRWECRTVRRDAVDGEYVSGLRYFWNVESGDPRFYRFVRHAIADGSGGVADTMAANNVVNPSILFDWVAAFDSHPAMDSISFSIDKHAAAYDVRALYEDYYGDPRIPQTKLGDLLHSKGELRTVRREGTELVTRAAQFRSYTTLETDLAAVNLTITRAGDGRISINPPSASQGENDLVSFETNLITASAIRDITGGLALQDGFNPDPLFIDVNRIDPVVTVTLDVTILKYAPRISNAKTFVLGEQAVSDALTLNWHGQAAFESANQDTNFGTFQNRRLVLTYFGLQLQCEQRIPLTTAIMFGYYDNAGSGGNGILDVLGTVNSPVRLKVTFPLENLDESSGVALIIDRTLTFPGFGFPDTHEYGFATPRVGRAYSVRTGADYAHPDIVDEFRGTDGADFETECVTNGTKWHETETKAPAAIPIASPGAAGHFSIWMNPDVLGEYALGDPYVSSRSNWLLNIRSDAINMPRFWLLHETFNAMASLVNALTVRQPYSLKDYARYPKQNQDESTLFAEEIDPVIRPTSANIPLAGRPLEQFAHTGTGPDGEWQWISIAEAKTFADANGFVFIYVDAAIRAPSGATKRRVTDQGAGSLQTTGETRYYEGDEGEEILIQKSIPVDVLFQYYGPRSPKAVLIPQRNLATPAPPSGSPSVQAMAQGNNIIQSAVCREVIFAV